jgi:DNA-binding MarR family transcriptional regulator
MNLSGGTPDSEAASQVSAALVRLTRRLRRADSSSPLSASAATALGTLERSGPLRLTALARAEHISQPAMTQLVGRLQRAGLVERTPDPADRRVVRVGITEAGLVALADRRANFAERLTELQRLLTPGHRAALAAAAPALLALSSLDLPETVTPSPGELL